MDFEFLNFLVFKVFPEGTFGFFYFSDFILKPGPVHFKKRKARFSDVWCGQYHTFAKDKDTNDIYSWGLNNYFQLGKLRMRTRYGRFSLCKFPKYLCVYFLNYLYVTIH